MTRIAILVEPHFMDVHVGVRNYLFSVRRLLQRRAKVDFVSFYRSDAGRPQWYRIALTDERFAVDNGLRTDRVYRGRPADVLEAWRADQSAPEAVRHPVAYTHFGPDLARERYDAAVISNPWMLRLDERVPVPEQYGLAYDAIPNRYVLTNANTPWVFANEHVHGFAYFRKHCRATFAISGATRDDLVRFFDHDPNRTHALPPMIPATYFDPAIPAVARDNSLVLASPLDKRKGLAVLPDMINAVADRFRRLFIYGGPRCPADELEVFFKALDPDIRLRWYARARAVTVKKLFARSRLLLFPSFEEGLGLPIIEAQMCGCRVAARPIEPMKSLMLDGSITVGADAKALTAGMAAALDDASYDHARLRESAIERFHPNRVEAVLASAMREPAKPIRLSA